MSRPFGPECVEWPFSKTKGYGRLRYNGRDQYAHRVALELHLGRPLRAGASVAHAPGVCHNPACFNPLHLREATHAENMADTVADNTSRRGIRNSNAVLTPECVRAIRAADGPQKDTAKLYGIHPTTVSNIKSRKSWDWLP